MKKTTALEVLHELAEKISVGEFKFDKNYVPGLGLVEEPIFVVPDGSNTEQLELPESVRVSLTELVHSYHSDICHESLSMWVCTRQAGHTGVHVAHAITFFAAGNKPSIYIRAIWPNKH